MWKIRWHALVLLLLTTHPLFSNSYLPPGVNAVEKIFTKQDPSYIDSISSEAEVEFVELEDNKIVTSLAVNGTVFKRLFREEINAANELKQPWQIIPCSSRRAKAYQFEFVVTNCVSLEMTYYAVKTEARENSNVIYPAEIITKILASKDQVLINQILMKADEFTTGYEYINSLR